jgi:hypothetical protein
MAMGPSGFLCGHVTAFSPLYTLHHDIIHDTVTRPGGPSPEAKQRELPSRGLSASETDLFSLLVTQSWVFCYSNKSQTKINFEDLVGLLEPRDKISCSDVLSEDCVPLPLCHHTPVLFAIVCLPHSDSSLPSTSLPGLLYSN